MTKKMLVALFIAVTTLASAPVMAAADCCHPTAECCDKPCC
jgi:hypothetical protein